MLRLTLAIVAPMFLAVLSGCQAIAGLNGTEPYPPDTAISTCATNELNCGATCADPATNAAHCGRCGNACPSGVPCVGGTCQCPGGLTGCDGGQS